MKKKIFCFFFFSVVSLCFVQKINCSLYLDELHKIRLALVYERKDYLSDYKLLCSRKNSLLEVKKKNDKDIEANKKKCLEISEVLKPYSSEQRMTETILDASLEKEWSLLVKAALLLRKEQKIALAFRESLEKKQKKIEKDIENFIFHGTPSKQSFAQVLDKITQLDKEIKQESDFFPTKENGEAHQKKACCSCGCLFKKGAEVFQQGFKELPEEISADQKKDCLMTQDFFVFSSKKKFDAALSAEALKKICKGACLMHTHLACKLGGLGPYFSSKHEAKKIMKIGFAKEGSGSSIDFVSHDVLAKMHKQKNH